MKQEKLKLLKDYLELGQIPILIEDTYQSIFKDSIFLTNDCQIEDLNGHYEGIDFCPPNWYTKLLNQSKKTRPVLMIRNINKIDINDQAKFIEILKYKQIATFELPKNTLIILTVTDLNSNKLNKEVASLVAMI